MWALAALCLGLGLGCYSPALRDCTVACEHEADCAGGQRCRAGWCTASQKCDKDGAVPDATHASADAAMQTLCELGCTAGTCVDGVCVIDCSAPGACSEQDVHCQPNLPCRVVCGDHACARKVYCDEASSCDVQCTGVDACGDEILCGLDRPCTIRCAGERACKKRIKCKEACACDASCTGAGSCLETPECPLLTACQVGQGCTSMLPGCDRCD